MGKGNFYIAVILEGLGIWVIIDSYKMGIQTLSDPGSGLFPFLLGISLCILALPICIGSLKDLKKSNLVPTDEGKGTGNRPNLRNIIVVTAFLTGYFSLLDILGYLITTFFLLLGLFWLGYDRKWLLILIISSVTLVLSYVIFDVFLKIPFPSGFWK